MSPVLPRRLSGGRSRCSTPMRARSGGTARCSRVRLASAAPRRWHACSTRPASRRRSPPEWHCLRQQLHPTSGWLTVARAGREFSPRDRELLRLLGVGLEALAAMERREPAELGGAPGVPRPADRAAQTARAHRAPRAGATARRGGGASSAVLLLDLDGFKRFNDSLGHAIGDQLLIEIAGRLEDCLRPTDTAARFGRRRVCGAAGGTRARE